MSINSSVDNASQVREYMRLIDESPFVFVYHKDVTFSAFVLDDSTISITQIEVKVHQGVQIDSSPIDELPNVSLFMIFSLVYEAKLDSLIDGSQHDINQLHNSYRIFLNHLSRNLFFAIENRDRWGDYINPFLYELADAILRKTSIFSSLIYNLGFKIEWKHEKIAKLTWFPLRLKP